MLQERKFIKTKENIYKLGKTRQSNDEQFKQYSNGSKLLLQIICNDCDEMERSPLKIFINKFDQQKDIGRKYFAGSYKEMIAIINEEIKKREN